MCTLWVLLNTYLCTLVSFPRVLAPPLQDARERREDGGIQSHQVIIISCAKWICPYVVKIKNVKTFKVNIDKARCPVEIYDMHGLFKLQR